MSPFDTIVAPITGSQPAAVAVIRVSGEKAWELAKKIFGGWPEGPESHRAYYGRFVTGDDGLALVFDKDRGYTGERSVELSIHGSPASVKALVEACIKEGARMAEPGEFTQRAFLNGRLDLTQAEGVRDTVESLTDAQLRSANAMRSGEFYRKIEELRDQALGMLAAVEASVDFSEEIGEFDRGPASTRVEIMDSDVKRMLETARTGRILRQGYRIAIVGPPNAGKSSLLNALLKTDRAIVTEVPGTTRDYVEETADFDGYPVVLIDTAGLRETADPVEALGIQRSRAAAANADEIWYVFDGSQDWPGQTTESFNRPVRFIANKCDIATGASTAPAVEALSVSALTGEGLSTLVETVKHQIDQGHQHSYYINDRHEALLNEVAEALDQTLRTLQSPVPDDLIAVTLRLVVHGLGQITGESASADMVDEIFRRFCIGK